MGLGRRGRFAEFNASELGGLAGFQQMFKDDERQGGGIEWRHKTRVSLGGSH